MSDPARVDLDFADLDADLFEVFRGGFREFLGSSRPQHYVTLGVMHYSSLAEGKVWIVAAGSELSDLGDVLPLAICRTEAIAYEIVERTDAALRNAGIIRGSVDLSPTTSHIELDNPVLAMTRREICQAVMARLGDENTPPPEFLAMLAAFRDVPTLPVGPALGGLSKAHSAYLARIVMSTLEVTAMITGVTFEE